MKKEADQKEALSSCFKVLGLPDAQDQKNFEYEKLKLKLAKYLDRLIVEDFNHLIAVLYRIDIPQGKATAALAAKDVQKTAGTIIAQLILERQLQKIETRRKYSQR